MARVVLTDIEGTTSSISFVKDVLFPYAARHLPVWLAANWHTPAVQTQIHDMAAHTDAPLTTAEQANAVLQQWITEDRKLTPLKALQGMIWKQGYIEGAYKAHMYPDAPVYLKAWKQQGLALYVYSSGSTAAQKLFFRYSEAGDLTDLFSGYFDTTIGAKRERDAYVRISDAIGTPAQDILFLSDIIEELDAARSAGMQTCWLDRGNSRLPCPHPRVNSFSEIDPTA